MGEANATAGGPQTVEDVRNMSQQMGGDPGIGSYWESRWQEGHTQWDVGHVTPVVETLLERIPADAIVLVPGCGSGYDLAALATRAQRVVGIDIAESACKRARDINSDSKNVDVIFGDAFAYEFETASFDMVFDYTFFCALPPKRRPAWGKRMGELIKPGGTLLTLMFPINEGKHHSARPPPKPQSKLPTLTRHPYPCVCEIRPDTCARIPFSLLPSLSPGCRRTQTRR